MRLAIHGTPKNSFIAVGDETGKLLSYRSTSALALRVNRDLRSDLRRELELFASALGFESLPDFRDAIKGFALSMSGVFQSIEHRNILQHLKDINFVTKSQPVISEDVAAIMAAAQISEGIVLKLSTGSNVFTKFQGHRIIEVGGWGSELADYGSGFSVGKLSISSILDSTCGRRAVTPKFTQAILDQLGLSEPLQLIEWYYTVRETSFWRSSISDIAIEVVRLAESESDPTAKDILEIAVSEFVVSLNAALRLCRPALQDYHSKIPVIFSGRLLKNSKTFAQKLKEVLRNHESNNALAFKVIYPIRHSILGSLAFAYCQTDEYSPEPEVLKLFQPDNCPKGLKLR